MKVAILVISFLAVATSSLAKPAAPKAVDWVAVFAETLAIQNNVVETAEKILQLASEANYEIGQQVSVILRAAVEEAEEVGNKIVEEIMKETLTAGTARGYYGQLEIIMLRASIAMQEPLSHLSQEEADEIRDVSERSQLEIQFKFGRIVYLLSCGDTC